MNDSPAVLRQRTMTLSRNGRSATIPGRNPALDGFGLIAFASLLPMITVMGYAQLAGWWVRLRSRTGQEG